MYQLWYHRQICQHRTSKERGVEHLHKSRRELAQEQIIGARQRSPPFFPKLCQHSGFVENVCLSMKKTMKCQCYTV